MFAKQMKKKLLNLQEFIPRGRQAVNDHPGPSVSKQQINVPIEHLLLYRLQNVNISNEESPVMEYWSIQEIVKDNVEILKEIEVKKDDSTNQTDASFDFFLNIEQELYVKGQTAVWTKGINEGEKKCFLPRKCFTCETPIQHAFFCSLDFIKAEDPDKREKKTYVPKKAPDCFSDFGICLIDSTSLRVYLPSGEYYLVSLEFLVSNVWQTNAGILLERNASTVMFQSESIAMPRLFSLSHPLNEMCPILMKSPTGVISFMTDDDQKVVFSDVKSDLILLYDNKIGKHFVSRIRKASEEEKQIVGGKNCIKHV